MENRLIEELDQLLKTKNYEALSHEEKLWVNEHLGSKSTYQKMRSLIQSAGEEKIQPVDRTTKQALMRKMKAKHQPVWVKALHYKIPAYLSISMSLLFIALVIILMPENKVIVEKTITVKAEPVVDTVVIQSDPDTVFLERIIKMPVYLTKKESKEEKKPEVVNPTFYTKSMAEQKDFRNLLVQSE